MIKRQAMRHPRAAVVRQHLKALEPIGLHDSHGVLRHGTLGISLMRCVTDGPDRISVAAQIHHHHSEHLGQLTGHCVPHHMGLRMPVQQQQRGAAATLQRTQVSRRALDIA
jgi:hypothetical protein